MNLYAESSAVAAWLFREPRGLETEGLLAAARYVVTSDLTIVEFARAVFRGVMSGRITEETAVAMRFKFQSAATSWDILTLLPSVVDRARQAFPFEPIRSLDALHVAWALHARTAIPDLAVLSLDQRVRRVSESLGFSVLPS